MANLKDLENHLETIYHAKENGGIVNIKNEAVFILGMCNEIRLEILKEVGGADLERDSSLPIDGVSVSSLGEGKCEHDYSCGTGTGYHVCRKCGDMY